jgi:hypothetical protein
MISSNPGLFKKPNNVNELLKQASSKEVGFEDDESSSRRERDGGLHIYKLDYDQKAFY